MNELGRRLDFDVENGLYQGRRNAIGFDGIWRSQGEPELIVEVKTTDTYRLTLETPNSYREALVEQRQFDRRSSILIVVGREDTGDLEAQVRGSRFAWDIRMIGLESLIKLVSVRAKSDDPATVQQIHQLLRPFEYTKVDRIVDILFATAIDVENVQEEEHIEPSANSPEAGDTKPQPQEKTERSLIEQMKDRAIKGFSSHKGQELVRRSRSYFWSADKTLRACCTVSKRYEGDYQPYWYAYHPLWDEFLKDGDGYLILACMDLNWCFAVPHGRFAEILDFLNKTEREDRSYWHIPLTTLDSGSIAINLTKVNKKFSLEPYRIPLPAV